MSDRGEFDVAGHLRAEIAAHRAVLDQLDDGLAAPFVALVELCVTAARSGGKVLLFGNGGSAADAQHIATELTVRYRVDRPPIPAIALTTDTSALTAIGNDLGFEALFGRQVEALARPGDVVIGISTSGNSQNVIRGLEAARRAGARPVGLTGGDAGRMGAHADPVLMVPSAVTARIQEMHILLGHALCDALEQRLGYGA
jgi:D-sedoheptulose 7-phosphate isomerase